MYMTICFTLIFRLTANTEPTEAMEDYGYDSFHTIRLEETPILLKVAIQGKLILIAMDAF
jgi:hypothetical protein